MYNFQAFSHIYIEKKILDNEITKEILSKFPDAKRIEINHYKDIFNRSFNNFQIQKKSQKIILAKKETSFLYPISQMIQAQNEEVFFYSSFVLNCLYDCQYCFLQGMYPSSYIVIFVNYLDFIDAIIKKYRQLKKPIFLSISYDSDLLVFENMINYIDKISYELRNFPITLELRSKSGNYKLLENIRHKENILLNYSLSPSEIISRYEFKTASLENRMKTLNKAINQFNIAITFDPLILNDDFYEIYDKFFEYVLKEIDFNKVSRIIMGVFRMNTSQLKQIRKTSLSDVIHYPYEATKGISTYNNQVRVDMINFAMNKFLNIDKNKIYLLDD